MNTELVVDEVRNRLGPLSEQAEKAVSEVIKILREQGKLESIPQPLDFVGQNISFDQYLSWTREQKRSYLDNAEKANRDWVENKLRELNAMWLIVINGKVISHGPLLRTFPDDDEFIALCKRHNKYPFVFFSPRMFFVEETGRWHPTSVPGDAYPTIVEIRCYSSSPRLC